MEQENISQSTDVNPFKVMSVHSASCDDAQLSQKALDRIISAKYQGSVKPKVWK